MLAGFDQQQRRRSDRQHEKQDPFRPQQLRVGDIRHPSSVFRLFL